MGSIEEFLTLAAAPKQSGPRSRHMPQVAKDLLYHAALILPPSWAWPSRALPKFESYGMLETAAFRGWKAKDAIEWFHGIGRLVFANFPNQRTGIKTDCNFRAAALSK
jgi:hypothetical protein